MPRSKEMENLLKACEPGTSALRFKLQVGFLNRGVVRRDLHNSVEKFISGGITATVTEDKYFLDSTFHFRAINIPDSYTGDVDRWIEKIKYWME